MQKTTNCNKNLYLIALGDKIRKLRIAKNMSQSELGSFCNLERQHISRLENGKVNPGFLCLIEIARALNVSVNELLELN